MSARRPARALFTFALGFLTSCACAGRAFTVRGPEETVALEGCAVVLETAAERARGLIGRPALAEREALWLEWPVETEVCIRNAGVEYAIDVLYVDAAGTVRSIERGLAAREERARCTGGVRRVIELRAGGADAVHVGASLRW